MIDVSRIEIWQPKYSPRFADEHEVWIDRDKVREHNIVYFTKAKHLEGKEYYISGRDVRQSPTTTNGKIPVYAVPMSRLEPMAVPEGKQ